MSHRIIFLWTVPRSVSTSFERMVSERGDHIVFDEPFSRPTTTDPTVGPPATARPCRDSSAEEVLAEIEAAALQRPVFVKDMAYQAAELLGPDLLERFDNCFLVRDPAATLRSLARRWPDFSDDESGWGTSTRRRRSPTPWASRGWCWTPTCLPQPRRRSWRVVRAGTN